MNQMEKLFDNGIIQDHKKLETINEILCEASYSGDLRLVETLIKDGANVNWKNKVNGMTPLHWACQREHKCIVEYLLKCNANPLLRRNDNLQPADMTKNEEILNLLNTSSGGFKEDDLNGSNALSSTMHPTFHPASLEFTPNYLKYPVFPFAAPSKEPSNLLSVETFSDTTNNDSGLLILKVRICGNDIDFNEIELPKNKLDLDQLQTAVVSEFGIKLDEIQKIRKLPDVVITKSSQVERLKENQELEIVIRK